MTDLIRIFWGSGAFIPHGHCYLWKPELVWLHVLSDSLIALAYYSISLTLFYFVRKRQDLPFNWVFLLFAAFITACGTTHLLEVWTLWHPIYWVSGMIKGGTAIVSLYTALIIVPLVQRALALPSPAQLEATNQELQQEIIQRQQAETLLRQSEAALQEQTRILSSILDSMSDGVVVADENGKFLYFSQAAEYLVGVGATDSPTDEWSQTYGLFLPDTVTPYPVSQLPLTRAIQGEDVEEIEVFCRHSKARDGIWISCNGRPLKAEDGTLCGGVVVLRDVTDRKRMEDQLRQSEARYRAVVEEQTELICRFLPDGTLTFTNSAYSRYFGRSQEELIQHSYLPVVLEEDLAKAEGQLNRLSQSNSVVTITNQVIRPNGICTQQWIVQAICSQQGAIVEFQAVGRDITALKQAEERLQQSEERLNTIVTTISDGILILSPDGNVRFANPAAVDLFGEQLNDRRLEIPIGEISEIEVIPCDNTFKVAEMKSIETEWMGEQAYILAVRDITDRKQAEAALQESEERYRSVVTAMAEGIILHDAEGAIVTCNASAERILGLSLAQMQGRTSINPDWHTIDEDGLPFWGEEHPAMVTLQTGNPCSNVIMGIYKLDGSLTWISINTQPLFRSGEPHPYAVVASFSDITSSKQAELVLQQNISDRKQAEAALRQSEAKNRAMLAAIPDLLLRVKRDGTCLDFIQPITPQSGVFIPIDTHLSEVLPPDLLRHQLQRMEQALATGTLQIWEHQLMKGSKLCDEEIRLVPCGDDEVLIVVRDISDRKQAEKQLELQSVIVKNMAGGVCLIRAADGVIVYTNPKFDQMFGYEPEELIGQHVSRLNYEDIHTNPRETARRIMSEIITDGEATYEVHNVRKDGTPFWCQATASMFEDSEHGTVLVAVQQDITEHLQAEEQIKTSLKEKEILLKEIHHRVKNNLQIIYSMLRLQRRSLKDPQASASLLDSQSRIEAIALIHEKLYQTGNLAQVDFTEYIPNIVSNLVSSYNINFKTILLDIDVAPIFLGIDRAIPCGLIINELISNSLKYAFPENQCGQIQVKLFINADSNITLIVKDDGIGLPKGFDLTQTSSLGLQLVQDFVDQLKGALQLDWSRGTEFRITFPGRDC